MSQCTYPGCTKPHQARGYCKTHYRKLRYWSGTDQLGTIQPHSPDGSSVSQKGYALYGRVEVHRIRAEKALGKLLPASAIVHHVNGDKSNPDADLVICPNQSYHGLIEVRTRAYNACGHADYLKCRYCQQWDDPIRGNMYVTSSSTHHRSCRNRIERGERVQ